MIPVKTMQNFEILFVPVVRQKAEQRQSSLFLHNIIHAERNLTMVWDHTAHLTLSVQALGPSSSRQV